MSDVPRRGARMKWALIASLGLNLALIGAIGGAVLKGPRDMPPAGLWHYGHALPEPYRRDLGHALRASRGDWIGPREALRGQRTALAAALETEPYDPAAVAAVLDRAPRLSGELEARGARLLLEQIARMGPGERADYADALRRDRGGRPDGRGRDADRRP